MKSWRNLIRKLRRMVPFTSWQRLLIDRVSLWVSTMVPFNKKLKTLNHILNNYAVEDSQFDAINLSLFFRYVCIYIYIYIDRKDFYLFIFIKRNRVFTIPIKKTTRKYIFESVKMLLKLPKIYGYFY